MAAKVSCERLRGFIAAAFVALGMPQSDANAVAGLMAEADLQGSDGHGVIRLPQYARRIRAGGVNLKPDISIARERAGMALLDGDNGMGHLVMKRRPPSPSTRRATPASHGWVRNSAIMPGLPRSTRGWHCRMT